jgi:hypothetical protein
MPDNHANRKITGLWISPEEASNQYQSFTAWGARENLEWIKVHTLSEAIDYWQGKIKLPASQVVELIVIEQTTSDEFEPAEADEFLAAVQACQVVVVYGSWCEGDGRTRNIWPPALRCPQVWAERWIRQILDALRSRDVELPWTASREEVMRWIFPKTSTSHSMNTIGWKVLSPDVVWRESMQLLLAPACVEPQIVAQKEASKKIWLVDADAWICQQSSLSASISARGTFKEYITLLAGEPFAESAEVVALTAWHDDTTRQYLFNQGADRVVSKLAFSLNTRLAIRQSERPK